MYMRQNNKPTLSLNEKIYAHVILIEFIDRPIFCNILLFDLLLTLGNQLIKCIDLILFRWHEMTKTSLENKDVR